MKILNKKDAFTLIELVIVLAIAALILAAVFLAIGGAQRSQRDSARKSIAGRVSTALENCASNNNGSYATCATLPASYLNGIQDPDTGAAPTPGTVSGAPGSATQGVHYRAGGTGFRCSGASGTPGTAVGGSTRQYAVVYWTENGNTTICLDNR